MLLLRLLLIASLIPIAICLAARWWNGTRVLANLDGTACRCDLKRWLPDPEDESTVHRAEDTAGAFGKQLRLKALAEWKSENLRAWRSRENARRFGMAVPPLSAIIAVFAVIVAKIPLIGLLAVPLAATAISTVIGQLSLPGELAAIARYAKRVRNDHAFPDPDHEEAVIRCACAHAWDLATPPILRCLNKPGA